MFDHCLYFNISVLARKVGAIWQAEFARVGLSPSHGYLLAAIAENAPVSQKVLSEILELDASTITRLVESLVARGFAKKTAKGKGGEVDLTDNGRRLHRSVTKAMDRLYNHMQSHFGEERFEEFVDALRSARMSIGENL
jgi:DNA-binding MarR family transcriptional regulator